MWIASRFVADKRIRLLSVVLIVLGLPLIPIEELMVAGYWFGIVGHISITTTLLLVLSVLRLVRPELKPVDDKSRWLLLILIGIVAIGFYPLALGASPFDPYRIGYQPQFMIVLLIALSLVAWFTDFRAAAFIILIAVLAYNIGLLESDNIWDYLFDPFLVIYAWALGIKTGYRHIRARIGETNKPAGNN